MLPPIFLSCVICECELLAEEPYICEDCGKTAQIHFHNIIEHSKE